MAANDAILVTTTGKALAQRVVNLSNIVKSAIAEANSLKAQLDHLTDGAADNATNYVTLETQIGVPTGKGKATYDLVTSLQAAMTASADVQNIAHKIQQSA